MAITPVNLFFRPDVVHLAGFSIDIRRELFVLANTNNVSRSLCL